MDISVSYFSSEGGREYNEDIAYISEQEKGLLAVVADGLGGMTCGDIAAKTAVKSILSEISMEEVSAERLTAAVEKANDDVRSEQNGTNMCTTIAALWLNSESACCSHAGDSRIYQIRNGEIIFQSKDHSVSQLAVMLGEIDPSEIRGHKDRNRLVRALGVSEKVKPETTSLSIKNGDAFVLCSDGFWELILEKYMVKYLGESNDAGEWLSKMRGHVEENQNKNSDNATAIAIIIKSK